MWITLGILVDAIDKEEAGELAERALESMCDDVNFDSAQLLDEDSEPIALGSPGGTPQIYEATSVRGQSLIREFMEKRRADFLDNMSKVRSALSKMTDDEILNEVGKSQEESGCLIDLEPAMALYYMRRAGAQEGPDIYLYDSEGIGVTCQHDVDSAIEHTRCTLYIVLAQAHY